MTVQKKDINGWYTICYKGMGLWEKAPSLAKINLRLSLQMTKRLKKSLLSKWSQI